MQRNLRARGRVLLRSPAGGGASRGEGVFFWRGSAFQVVLFHFRGDCRDLFGGGSFCLVILGREVASCEKLRERYFFREEILGGGEVDYGPLEEGDDSQQRRKVLFKREQR